MAMFYKDTAGKINVVNPLAADDEANLGLKARYEFKLPKRVIRWI